MSSGTGPLSGAELIWPLNLQGVFRYKQQHYDYARGRQLGEGEERRDGSRWWVTVLGNFPRMLPKFQPPQGMGAQGIAVRYGNMNH